MKSVYLYQIIDEVSEGVIATFIGPNDVFANRQFKAFLTDPKMKDRIISSDFFLVKSYPVEVFESYGDYCADVESDDYKCFVSYGNDVLIDDDFDVSVKPVVSEIVKEVSDEA